MTLSVNDLPMRADEVPIYCLLLSRREIDRLATGEIGDDPVDLSIRRKAEEKQRLIIERKAA